MRYHGPCAGYGKPGVGTEVAPVQTMLQCRCPPASDLHTRPGKEHGREGSAHAMGLSADLIQCSSSGSEALLAFATATRG
eukprot:COSAG02_NODE_57960_length_279_cov_0.566667_1_plen_79_part_01